MSNEVLNRTEENAITLITYKVSYNNQIYYFKEFINRNGDLMDSYIYDSAGYQIEENYEDILKIVHDFDKNTKLGKV